MTFHPVLHPPVESLRFGRVLPVEIAPPPDPPCRYCRVLTHRAAPARAYFSVPDAVARAVLNEIGRGTAVEAVVFCGPGEPVRHRGLGAILRRIRTASHVPGIVLTGGVLLSDRDVRRELTEAQTIVAWLPALRDASADDARARAELWERHVEGIASLRRGARTGIALEIPVRPGVNDGKESRRAWRRAAERIRPDRVFVVPDPHAEEDAAEAMERVRAEIHPRAGAFLPDGTLVDVRCACVG
jgi:wyosine [tRNA(Phe)-imidazoG37] synthetase (radical SAM superfamily)